MAVNWRTWAQRHPRIFTLIVAAKPLILAGVAFRLAAHGCIKKKEALACTGVYSLCRHPLYLGSMLITYGFCCLLNDPKNFVLATLYFGIFYTLTILWEEIRVSERFGEAHRRFAASTPLLLPVGRYRSGAFDCRRAIHNGGAALIAATLALLGMVEVMAETMPHWQRAGGNVVSTQRLDP